MKKGIWVIIWLFFAFKIDFEPNTDINSIPSVFKLSAPVRHELSITGSFGELRNNHFHGGLDIRSSRGPTGDDILAAADGYVSKIMIEPDNLGKSLYISHPNGLMTVYAHLNDFRKDLSNYVKAKQYELKSFQQDLHFDPDDFPVKAGDLVAYMGNTGASRGKHLHFEVRNANGDEVWDPLHFGLPLADNIAPSIRRIKVYGYDETGQETSSKIFNKLQISKIQKAIEIPGDVFSVGLDAFDRSNNSWTSTGIKSIQLFIDGGLFYHFSADNWKRDDTKYINAHIDFNAKTKAKGQFHRCFLLSGNKMNLYKTVQNDGFFFMTDSTEHQVKLITGDANGNKSEISFTIVKRPFKAPIKKVQLEDWLYPDQEKIFETANARLKYPAGSVYEDLNCKICSHSNPSRLSCSAWTGLRPAYAPIHLPAEIRLKPTKTIPEHLKSKCFIAIEKGKSVQSVGGRWEGDELVSHARSLGPFCIMIDTIAPKLNLLVSKKKKYALKNQLAFRVYDNISTSREVPAIHFDLKIDGQWVLMDYDKKTNSIRHYFEDWLGKGKHSYEISLRDYLGNEKTYSGSFIRT